MRVACERLFWLRECLLWGFTSINLHSSASTWSNDETGWGGRLLSSYEGCYSLETQLSPLGLPRRGFWIFKVLLLFLAGQLRHGHWKALLVHRVLQDGWWIPEASGSAS